MEISMGFLLGFQLETNVDIKHRWGAQISWLTCGIIHTFQYSNSYRIWKYQPPNPQWMIIITHNIIVCLFDSRS